MSLYAIVRPCVVVMAGDGATIIDQAGVSIVKVSPVIEGCWALCEAVLHTVNQHGAPAAPESGDEEPGPPNRFAVLEI